VLRLIFHPAGLRPHITNWDDVAHGLLQRVQREAVGNVVDDDLRALVDEVLAYPDVPAHWRQPDLAATVLPIIPVRFARDGKRFAYFSTVTTLGTPVDVTAQETRIECFFPVDDETRTAALEFAR